LIEAKNFGFCIRF